MKELLEELKHNQEINKKEGLENRIQIDYIIERLEDIEKDLESYLKDRVEFLEGMIGYAVRDNNDKAIYEYSMRKFEVETIKEYIEEVLKDA